MTYEPNFDEFGSPEKSAERIKRNEKILAEEMHLINTNTSKVRTLLLLNRNAAFLTSQVFNKDIVFNPKITMSVALTDGKRIEIDPEMWARQDPKMNAFILAHEGLHCLFSHIDKSRMRARDHKLWNIAVDCVVNSTLVVLGIGTLPPYGITSDSHGTVELDINDATITIAQAHKLSGEEVYDKLLQHTKKNKPKGGDGKGQSGTHQIRDSRNGDKIETDAHEPAEITDAERTEQENSVREALARGKMQGDMPGWLEDQLHGLVSAKVDYKSELRDLFLPLVKTRSSFSRPNRRRSSSGMMFPGGVREGVKIGALIDTSGSMGNAEIQVILGEMKHLFSQFEKGSVECTVYLHDTEVYKKLDVMDSEEVDKLRLRAGGGTCHLEPFERVQEDNLDAVISFTDGYSSFPDRVNLKKTLFIVTDKDGLSHIPDSLGKKIYISTKELGGN